MYHYGSIINHSSVFNKKPTLQNESKRALAGFSMLAEDHMACHSNQVSQILP